MRECMLHISLSATSCPRHLTSICKGVWHLPATTWQALRCFNAIAGKLPLPGTAKTLPPRVTLVCAAIIASTTVQSEVNESREAPL